MQRGRNLNSRSIRMRIMFLGLFILSAFATASRPVAIAKDVDVRGHITSVHAASDADRRRGLLGSIRVEGEKATDTSVDKAVVRVTSDTELIGVDGARIQFEMLAVG